VRIKLDRTVCDGFGICALHASDVFSLDDWGYPSLAAGGEIGPENEEAVRRALLDCPAHAIVDLGERAPLPAGGEAGVARATRSGQAFASSSARVPGTPSDEARNRS
jgi:ferredoxin